jgi:uncharacterized RDD family membrane protein YckC
MQSPTNVVGKRVGAFVIDVLIIWAITAIAWFALTKNFGGPCFGGGIEINGDCRGFEAGSGNRTIFALISIIIPIGIQWVMQGLTGKTPGKAVVGIKVVNPEGQPPGIGRAAVRSILAIVDAFPYLIPYLTGFITALSSKRNQRVGDMVAKTFVVDKSFEGPVPTPEQIASGPQQFAPTAGWNAAPTTGPAPQPPQAQGEQKADWYPDPHGQARLRYWDGQRWTEHTSA